MHHLLKKDVTYFWSEEANKAFETIKQRLVTSPILDLPNFDTEFLLYMDASKFAVGYVLGQVTVGKETVIWRQ